jgi:hypothetical protein
MWDGWKDGNSYDLSGRVLRKERRYDTERDRHTERLGDVGKGMGMGMQMDGKKGWMPWVRGWVRSVELPTLPRHLT